MQLSVFMLLTWGIYMLLAIKYPISYKKARVAVKARNPTPLNSSDALINSLAQRLVSYISIDPLKRYKLVDELRSLEIATPPELFRAKAIAKGVLYALPCLILLPISFFFVIIAGFICMQTIAGQDKKLKLAVEERKRSIERELPQFAGTVRQSLNTTRNVISIMESYVKVCGKTLRREIEITLNDLKTGNAERALRSLDGRVGSSKFSEFTRGLIGINRGDDMKIYFDMLAVEYQKSENEAVKKDLLNRPAKLAKYMAALFACLFVMTILTIGMMIIAKSQMFF